MKLTDLPRLSTARAEALRQSGISSPEELLLLPPHRYIDRRSLLSFSDLRENEQPVLTSGRLVSVRQAGFGRKKRLEATFHDRTGQLQAVWFRGAGYIRRLLKEGEIYSIFGKPTRYGSTWSMAHPEIERIRSRDDLKKKMGIQPIYPGGSHFSRSKINSSLISSWIRHILEEECPEEILPHALLSRHSLPERGRAFRMLHQPADMHEPGQALDRFKFEEFFLFQLSMARIRHTYVERTPGVRMDRSRSLTKPFLTQHLPFELTDGQKQAIREIDRDLASGDRMNRLLQGDVGSGKTVVAITAMLRAIENGFQAAMMAPTEILAEQHYHTLRSMLAAIDVDIRCLTGGQSKPLRQDLLTSIEGGKTDLVVGTHALIQQDVRFHRLGLAVVDEQHRFGVRQRADLLAKGDNPHLLVMSATPIPRSLALTLYSDLDISVVRGLPAGRKPVKTAVRMGNQREDVYRFLESNANEGGQAYIVYPLVEESEALDLKDATDGYRSLSERFPSLEIGLLHGQMPSDEKERTMKRFQQGELDILVSTTVIEVGVDVPNANAMVIEHAERFGLSQLHQLRGRIGRGKKQSYCILMPGTEPGDAGRFRLKKMIESHDGFEIAEADLKLRGPGDVLGTRQSGLPEFRFGDIVEDRQLLTAARSDAREMMKIDPELEKPDHTALRVHFEPYYRQRVEWFGLG